MCDEHGIHAFEKRGVDPIVAVEKDQASAACLLDTDVAAAEVLRREGLLKTRRDGQTIYYQLADRNVTKFFGLLEDLFCKGK